MNEQQQGREPYGSRGTQERKRRVPEWSKRNGHGERARRLHRTKETQSGKRNALNDHGGAVNGVLGTFYIEI